MIDTYNKIKSEVVNELLLLRKSINFNEYFSTYYFTISFIDEVKDRINTEEECDCKKDFVTPEKFEGIMIDICSSYSFKDDVMLAIVKIFAPTFISTKVLN